MRPPKQFQATLAWLREQLPTLADELGQLPTERHLSKMRKASVTTVRKALYVLEQEGMVARCHGKGTFLRHATVNGTAALAKRVEPAAPAAHTISVLAHEAGPSGYPKRGIYQDAYRGIFNEATARGIALSVSLYTGRAASVDRFLSIVANSKVEGCILVGMSDEPMQQRIAAAVPAGVVVDHWPAAGTNFDSVETDSQGDTREAVRVLAHLGHQRIAFVDRARSELNPDRRAGYEEGLKEAGLEAPASYRLNVKASRDEADKALKKLMALKDAPTAVIAYEDGLCEMLRRAAEHQKIKVPGQLSIVGFGSLPEIEADPARASCMATDFERMGRMAVQRLSERFAQPGQEPRRVFVPGQFFVGSTAAPPASKALAAFA